MMLLVTLLLAVRPTPVPALTDPSVRVSLAADEDALYWTEELRGQIRMLPAGGKPVTLVHGRARVELVAVDDGHLYWFERESIDGAARLMRMRTSAGSTQVVLVPKPELPTALAAGAGLVVWTSEDAVWAVPSAGGRPRKLAGGQFHPSNPAVVGRSVCWVNEPPPGPTQRTSGELPIPRLPGWVEAAGDKVVRAKTLLQHAGRVGCVAASGAGAVRWVATGLESPSLTSDGKTLWYVRGSSLHAIDPEVPGSDAVVAPVAAHACTNAPTAYPMAARDGAVSWLVDTRLYGLSPGAAPVELAQQESCELVWALVRTASRASWATWHGVVLEAPVR